MIDQLVEQMEESARLMPNDTHKELIDVEQYVDMPSTVLEGKNLSDTKGDKTNTTTTYNNTTTTYNSTKTSSNTTYVKQAPTVMSVKRKGKLPSPDRLTAMRQKVMQLATGVFEFPPLPTLKCDIEDARIAEEEAADEKSKKNHEIA